MSWRPSDGPSPSFRFFPSPAASSSSSSAFPPPPSASEQGSLQRSQDSCSYTRSIVSRCITEPNKDGRPVKKCEKTEQLLRNCVGRPQEIVESKTEYTEEDFPNEWTPHNSKHEKDLEVFHGFPSSLLHPFEGMDPFSRGLSDGLDSFLQAAEEMMNHAFNQLGFYRQEDRDRDSHIQQKLPGRRLYRGPAEESRESKPSRKVQFSDFRSFDEA